MKPIDGILPQKLINRVFSFVRNTFIVLTILMWIFGSLWIYSKWSYITGIFTVQAQNISADNVKVTVIQK